jgi:hypothetical protein
VKTYPVTPDGRYFVVRGRLWRSSEPHLSDEKGRHLRSELMAARRAKGLAIRAGDEKGREKAKQRINAAKIALGERGPVWWTDGSPDFNRRMAKNTEYSIWFASLEQAL